MKLPIKDQYFKQIKDGKKILEFRDAHITFLNEDTGDKMCLEVLTSRVIASEMVDDYEDLRLSGVLEDPYVIEFTLGEITGYEEAKK